MNSENMNERNLLPSQAKTNKNYVLKILFGPMYGCELQLPAADYFLIIDPSSMLLNDEIYHESKLSNEHAVSYAINSLYIPCEVPSSNITLRLTQPVDSDQQQRFHIEINDNHLGNQSLFIDSNVIFTYQNLKLAVKESGEVWSDEISNFPLIPEVSSSKAPLITSAIKVNRFKKNIGIAMLIAVIFISFLSGYTLLNNDRQVATLHHTLADAPDGIRIVSGKDQTIYLLLDNNRAFEWTREALVKLSERKNIVLYPTYKHAKELIGKYNLSGYPILRIDYSNSQEISVFLYKSLSPSEAATIKKSIMKDIPFTSDVIFTVKPAKQLISDARQGLERLNIHFKQIDTQLGLSFIIRDALSDNAMNSLYKFITDFQNQWGDTFINFSVHLDENWLQNKSYVDSDNGYLFLNPRHWYFPINNKEF